MIQTAGVALNVVLSSSSAQFGNVSVGLLSTYVKRIVSFTFVYTLPSSVPSVSVVPANIGKGKTISAEIRGNKYMVTAF